MDKKFTVELKAVATLANFSCAYCETIEWLGEPDQEKCFPRPKSADHIIASWDCGCEFHETEAGSGILFACEEHSK